MSAHAFLQVLPSLKVSMFLFGEVKQMAFQEARADSTLTGIQGRGGIPATTAPVPRMGLDCEVVGLSELAAAKAMLQGEVLRADVTRVGGQMRGFFLWLHRMWHQLEGGVKVGQAG